MTKTKVLSFPLDYNQNYDTLLLQESFLINETEVYVKSRGKIFLFLQTVILNKT